MVVDCTSFMEGVTTFRISPRTSTRKSRTLVKVPENCPGTGAAEFVSLPCGLLETSLLAVASAFAIKLPCGNPPVKHERVSNRFLQIDRRWSRATPELLNWQGRSDSNREVRFWRPPV